MRITFSVLRIFIRGCAVCLMRKEGDLSTGVRRRSASQREEQSSSWGEGGVEKSLQQMSRDRKHTKLFARLNSRRRGRAGRERWASRSALLSMFKWVR